MLAGKNDLELLEETKVGRNINRHYYSVEEVAEEIERPVVKRLLELMKFRNSHKAFDGEFILNESSDDIISITRRCGEEEANLVVNLENKEMKITYTKDGEMVEL